MSSMQIVKAGWLWRKSSVLHRWDKQWFVLYTTGELKYFENPDKYQAIETCLVPRDCKSIAFGSQVSVTPPEYQSPEALLTLTFHRSAEMWYLCAESADDAQAWKFMLDQAISLRPGVQGVPVNYPTDHQPAIPAAYPQQYPAGGTYMPAQQHYPYAQPHQPVMYNGVRGDYVTPQSVYQNSDGTQTVVIGKNGGTSRYCYDDYNYYYGRYPYGYRYRYGCNPGFYAGAAAASLMWSPLMWYPMFW